MMSKITMSLVGMACCANLLAQVTISGSVVDGKSNPIPGVNIFIKDSYDGTSSDANGLYTFECFESDSQTLSASAVGFENFELPFKIGNVDMNIKIVLSEVIDKLDIVTISAGSFEASDEKKAVVLKPLDIVTTAGSNGDVFGALEKLPGTSNVGEQEGLFVRGGSAQETVTIIDEMMVQDPYMSAVPDVPQRGRFSPFSFKGTVFSTGGYSAQYGQALSAAVILNSQDLATQTSSNIGIMPVGLSAGHIKAWEKTSLGVDVGYSNTAPFFALNNMRLNWIKPPQGWNVGSIFRHKTSQTGLLKYYGTASNSSLGIAYDDIDRPGQTAPFEMDNINIYQNATWREILNDKWTVFLGTSLSYDNDEMNIMGTSAGANDQLGQGKMMFTRTLGQFSSLKIGAEQHHKTSQNSFGSDTLLATDNYTAAFTELDWVLTPGIAARVGARWEYSSLLGEMNIAPRTALAIKTGSKSQVNLAYGEFFQTPRPERDENLYRFYSAISLSDINYEKATHLIANYQYIDDNRTFRIEGYHKKYNQLLKADNQVIFDNDGNGYARGFDVFYRDKKTIKYADFWISYSYLDTERNFRAYPILTQPDFATTHNLNVVYKHWINPLRLQLGVTYDFSTGRPYFNPNLPADQFLSERTPNFHNVSINGSHLTELWGNFTVVFFSINNVPGIDNVFNYRFSADGQTRTPVKATIVRSVFLGVFISINHD